MTLNSTVFVFVFLPLVLLAFYGMRFLFKGSLRDCASKIVLLLASIAFYAWSAWSYLPLLFTLIAVNYILAFLLEGKFSRFVLALGVACDVAALVFYKYFNFFGESLDAVLGFGFSPLPIIQPLGISFLVFSLISYLVDVYRGELRADRSLLNVALWATFFPKVISGPIVRYSQMYSGGGSSVVFSSSEGPLADLSYGSRRFVIGFAKKVIIADTLGVVADGIFSAQMTGIDTPTAWLGILCYTFQIFFDFSGYSDMAIGVAAMFGFRFKENFDYPYMSKTIGEFWHRWHISLSTWLRDYVYFSLGGSRRGNVYINLLIVFLVSGLWHGADWHFVAWGLWYALFMVVDRLYRSHSGWPRIPAGLSWLATMLVVVFGWVWFRADGVTQAVSYMANLVGLGTSSAQFFGFWYYLDARIAFLLVISVVCSTPVFAKMRAKYEGSTGWAILRCVAIPLLFVISVLFMVNSSYSPFLYAQF